MRFYTKPHQFYCGIDLHARSMYFCILSQYGEILRHRNMPGGPEPFAKAVAPYGADLAACVEGLFTRIGRLTAVRAKGFRLCSVTHSA